MNWEALHVAATVLLALCAAGNFIVLLQIDKKIGEAVNALKDWARNEFVTQREIDKRLAAIEKRA